MGNTALVIVTEPSEEPITLDQAKQHLRIDTEDDDTLILGLIKVAREYAETATRRALMTQTWNYYLEDWPKEDHIDLPMAPLQSIGATGITYENSSGGVTTLTTGYYEVDTLSVPGRVVLGYNESWPTATLNVSNPICIKFVAGHGTPDDVPEMIKSGMKIDLADLYEQRESYIIGQTVNHLPVLDRLYTPFKVWGF